MNPVKRGAIYQSKSKGGLGIFDVYFKAKCILTSTFLKQFLDAQEKKSFLKYFCSMRLNPMFNIRELPTNLTFTCPWYFNEIVNTLRTCLHIKNFPNIRYVHSDTPRM